MLPRGIIFIFNSRVVNRESIKRRLGIKSPEPGAIKCAPYATGLTPLTVSHPIKIPLKLFRHRTRMNSDNNVRALRHRFEVYRTVHKLRSSNEISLRKISTKIRRRSVLFDVANTKGVSLRVAAQRCGEDRGSPTSVYF